MLEAGPQSPTALAHTAKTSVATVHRKLKEALHAGLVVKLERGPATQYRASTNEEHLARIQEGGLPGGAAPQHGDRVFLETDRPTAGLIQRALELYARLGLGQFETLLDLARFEDLRRTDGSVVPAANMDEARELLTKVKSLLTGLESNASYGISGSKVGAEFQKAWDVQRAVRHRLAWDRNPEGGLSVQFDEPLGGWLDRQALRVSSGACGPSVPDLLEQLPEGMFMGKRGRMYRVIGPDKANSAWVLHAESESPQTALLMAKNVAKGAPARTFSF